jgi:glutathione S-transferase
MNAYGDIAMPEWTPLDQAIDAQGVRLVLARLGVPSPWSEFCRAIFDVKSIPYSLVDARDAQGTYRPLKSLTAQESVPVVLIDRERSRSGWLDQLYAAERLSSSKPLLPSDAAERSIVVGLVAELCGEGGLGWCRRLQFIAQLLAQDSTARDKQVGGYLKAKYGSDSALDYESRSEAIVSLMADRLRSQHAAGRSMFVGKNLTAVDLAWAAFAALLQPLPEPVCPMDSRWRDLFCWVPKTVPSDDLSLLLTHRDRIYHDFLKLPVPIL